MLHSVAFTRHKGRPHPPPTWGVGVLFSRGKHFMAYNACVIPLPIQQAGMHRNVFNKSNYSLRELLLQFSEFSNGTERKSKTFEMQ